MTCPARVYDPVVNQLVQVEVVDRYCVTTLATQPNTASSGKNYKLK